MGVMVRRRKERKAVNVKNARTARDRGLSYAEIARLQNVSPTAIFYALNPRKRRREGSAASGRPRSVYLSDQLWSTLIARAEAEGTSASKLVAAIVLGDHKAIILEPEIPGA